MGGKGRLYRFFRSPTFSQLIEMQAKNPAAKIFDHGGEARSIAFLYCSMRLAC
jgi:hypothetical protein